MSAGALHLFLELVTLVCFLAVAAHAAWLRGRGGLGLVAALLWTGFVRENFVLLQELLYGFAPLHLQLGRAPMIAAIVWPYSIYLALVWAEVTTGEALEGRSRPGGRLLGAVALFMMALACFYEPVLARVGMARWEEGTRATLGVPWIALAGYPTLACAALALWAWAARRIPAPGRRTALLLPLLAALALAHAGGLQALKDLLGW